MGKNLHLRKKICLWQHVVKFALVVSNELCRHGKSRGMVRASERNLTRGYEDKYWAPLPKPEN